MVTDCTFCKFASNPQIKIWENELFFGMFDSFPVGVGHTLIIPKRHVVSLIELKDEEWGTLKVVNSKLLKMIAETDFKQVYSEMLKNSVSEKSEAFLQSLLDNSWINSKPAASNFGVNDGREAGRTVDHFHWHIIPRYKGDMEDPTGGVRHVIPERGNYKK